MLRSLYLPWWFVRAKFFRRHKPLQSVVFISDLCNLKCKHCCVYSRQQPTVKTYAQIEDELRYCYSLGSRFIDFEGGEPTLWRDGEHDINSLVRLARRIGFFSTTITTNAIRPFPGLEADSLWVSLDGLGAYHDAIRGEGAFDKLVANIASSGHKHLNVNMVVNSLNYPSVEETIQFAADNPHIRQISLNFHTPYPGTEQLFLPWDIRHRVIDRLIALKRHGAPILNSISGLRLMRDNQYRKCCWISNFVMVDGTRLSQCNGFSEGLCDRCGFCMAGESASIMRLSPDTVFAGLRLRL